MSRPGSYPKYRKSVTFRQWLNSNFVLFSNTEWGKRERLQIFIKFLVDLVVGWNWCMTDHQELERGSQSISARAVDASVDNTTCTRFIKELYKLFLELPLILRNDFPNERQGFSNSLAFSPLTNRLKFCFWYCYGITVKYFSQMFWVRIELYKLFLRLTLILCVFRNCFLTRGKDSQNH